LHGVKVAQLSYTFGFNGLQRPAGRNWIANLIDPAAIIAEARRARAAGAQIVVVSLHWGTEYDHGANADQQRLARQLLAAPEIDLILGCHAHVVQPFEKIGDKWVAYGMGNEIARHSDPVDATREGVMPRFTFTEVAPGRWRVTRAEAIPTWVDLTPDIHMVDLPAALADPATPPAQREIYRAARTRIAGYVRARHADVTVL
jgi:poly-gamma-glutamate synthesis protein (capsule biosynthesis protein)